MQTIHTPSQLLPEFEFARSGHSYSRPVIWSLWSDGLHLTVPGESERYLPYTTLAAIRLYVVPMKQGENIFHCALTFQNGQTLDFTNYQMTAPGRSESQNAGYRAFVETLLKQAKQYAPTCQLMSGQKAGIYIPVKILTMILVPCFLLYLYVAWQHDNLTHAAINVALIMAPLLAILGSPPKKLDPSNILPLLPAS